MQALKSHPERPERPNRPKAPWGRVCFAILVLMATLSPLTQAVAAGSPAQSPPSVHPAQGVIVTATCLNSSSAQTNLSLTMHNIFLVMAGIGGGLVVLALVFWGIQHSTTSVFEESSAEQKMKRRRQLFDILIGGLVILMAATIWGVAAGTVVGVSC